MNSSERQIKITITKIINYHEPRNAPFLSIVFISKKNGSLILTKNVKAFSLANELIINANLKI